MLCVYTGENRILSGALLHSVGHAMARDDTPLYIIVPRQLTLLTERLLLDGLHLPGSFRLRVLSPARLCALIFDAAGAPEGVRVDERGRVLLMRRAIRAAKGLTIYRGADRRRGFAERCARQLELFIQGGVSPEDLRGCAEDAQGATRMKLNDLAAILEQYQALIRDRFQDGDGELIEAEKRAGGAAFLREGRFWFFGFDITPPTLTRLIARVAAICPEAAVYLPLPNDPEARDYDCCQPLERALARLFAACRNAGADCTREKLEAAPGAEATREKLEAVPGAEAIQEKKEDWPGAEATREKSAAEPGAEAVREKLEDWPGARFALEKLEAEPSAEAARGKLEAGPEEGAARGKLEAEPVAEAARGKLEAVPAAEAVRGEPAAVSGAEAVRRKLEAGSGAEAVREKLEAGHGAEFAQENSAAKPSAEAAREKLGAGHGAGAGRGKPAAEPAAGCLATLSRELFAYPPRPWRGEVGDVTLVSARDVREECMLAAAKAREWAMGGVRYGEIQLLCGELESYRQPLAEAFAAYGVPLFQEGSRPVSRLATAECLLTALKLIDRNFRTEDAFTLMRCGYMDLSDDEAGRLANYATRYGLEGARWLRPLSRGSEEEIESLEPIRARLMAPVRKLREDLKAAPNLKGQLAALFGFLTKIDAHGRSLELQRRLIEGGMREAAGALTQSWNRVVGALDQMAALMGEARLSLRELDQALTESLEAAVVKPLPQSGDAVYAQSLGRMLMQPARALIVIGLGDSSAGAEEGLLTQGQRRAVEQRTRAYLGPDEADVARLRRFYLKAALGMATEAAWFSCALSALDGSAQRPGLTMRLLRELLPGLEELNEMEKARLLACAPRAALGRAARALSARRAGESPEPGDLAALSALRAAGAELPEAGARLGRMERLLVGDEGREAIDPASVRALYGALQTQSITRLERFARCPFSYFAAYGLRPERVEPFEFRSRDEGDFLHAALSAFLSAHKSELNELSPEAAEEAMDGIARELLASRVAGTPLEDKASVRAESRQMLATARRCARVLTEHMKGSAFRATELERPFGPEDGDKRLQAGDTVLEGRIDRVDVWPEGGRLRVIDYKLGGKALSLDGAYYGLELQLPVYLGAAMKQRGARSAGVYYFALDEGVVDTQSTDPAAVEAERAKRFRMAGLLPDDMELLRAQTPVPGTVFNTRFKANGELWDSVPRASDRDFARLVRCALRRAEEHIGRIRAGEAGVRPASFDGRDACRFCDYRAACLFDSKLDAGKVRRLKGMDWSEVFERMALEEEGKAQGEAGTPAT